jgi:hypothetical protein
MDLGKIHILGFEALREIDNLVGGFEALREIDIHGFCGI